MRNWVRVLAASIAAALTGSVIAGGINIDGNVISWPDDGWYQVQRLQDYSTVCEGGRSCTVDPGRYIVINHTSGQRYEDVLIKSEDSAVTPDTPSTPSGITVNGNTILVPDDGWYQIQSALTFQSFCEGVRACEVPDGIYNVINLTTGQRTTNVAVGVGYSAPDPESPGHIVMPPGATDPDSDGISVSTLTIDGNTIRWPDDGWYQVQSAFDYRTVCEGGNHCDVVDGEYIAINLSAGKRYEGLWVGNIEQQKIRIPASITGSVSVNQMDSDGKQLAISKDNGDQIHIYRKDEKEQWKLVQSIKLNRADVVFNTWTGIGINGPDLAISHYYATSDQREHQELLLYRKASTGAFREIQRLPWTTQGAFVSANSLWMAGNSLFSTGRFGIGRFEFNSAELWYQSATIEHPDAQVDPTTGQVLNFFGNDIELHGSRLVTDFRTSNQGFPDRRVLIYNETAPDVWVLEQELTHPDSENVRYGKSLAVTDKYVVVAREDSADLPLAVLVYQKNNEGIWTRIREFEYPGIGTIDSDDIDVEVTSEKLFVGLSGGTGATKESGVVLVYDLETLGESGRLIGTGTGPGDRFGLDLQIAGNQIVVFSGEDVFFYSLDKL